MEIHMLDIIMYFVLLAILWIFILPEDCKEELGILVGWAICLAYTVIYMIIFFFFNWSDIFSALGNFNVGISW